MSNNQKFYINGEWVEPAGEETIDVINPATEEAIGSISLGTHADVDAAVAAAQKAFATFSQTSVEERMDLLNKITEIIGARSEDCLLYTSPSPRDATLSRMPSSA